jgi:Golgi apyrase
MVALSQRKKGKMGPVKSKTGVPYDYIVIVDSGSKGLRVFVYNWPNPSHVLGDILSEDAVKRAGLQLVGTLEVRNEPSDDATNEGDTSVSESDSESDSDSDFDTGLRLPPVYRHKKWSKKIKPGISSFSQSPQKIGNHHIKYLLQLASSVVPKLQHHRTPFFLHSTAGMRLLSPNHQQKILNNICEYVTKNSDFYIPDCASHINVIDGDVEGLYGWLSINYMLESFDAPERHQHGKNHTTYGLLDMGGASTQVVFLPNSTETAEHRSNLFDISLHKTVASDNYTHASRESFKVYSDSYLGFGMYQAHNRYLAYLIDEFITDNKLEADRNVSPYPPAGLINEPIVDPCLPKGYISTSMQNEYKVDFTGTSNFDKCLNLIFPVILNSTYSPVTPNCKQFGDAESGISLCLLNDLIPAFDFDVNHFIGVSGYWDSIKQLLTYGDEPSVLLDKRKQKAKTELEIESYDYQNIFNATAKVCSTSLSELMALNAKKTKSQQFTSEELSQLCFKSSWILNFLHLGLGFPRFGLDQVKNQKFQSLQLIELVDGSAFSWTLGRALLYSNDEYAQAFNNYTIKQHPQARGEDLDQLLLPRSGFFHSTSVNDFHFGAEQKGVLPRPAFTNAWDPLKSPHFDYETGYETDDAELKWYIEPHRWYGLFIFMFMLGFIAILLLGKNGRRKAVTLGYEKWSNLATRFHGGKYAPLHEDGQPGLSSQLTSDRFELEVMSRKHPSNDDFAIASDEEV